MITEIEYLTLDNIIVSTAYATQTTLHFEPIFYILDNGVEIADKCHCEDCAVLACSLMYDSIDHRILGEKSDD